MPQPTLDTSTGVGQEGKNTLLEHLELSTSPFGELGEESEKWKRENQHGHCTSGKLQGSHPCHQQHSSSANPFLDQEQAERRFLLPPAAAFLGGVPEGGADMLESCCVTEQHFVRAPAAMAKLGHSWWEPGN